VRLAELRRTASGDGVDPASLRLACEVHDVGKIVVPDQILNKAGVLTPAEHDVVQSHTRTGRRLLEPLIDDDVVLDGVAWHHEWWDGTGYPDGLVGEEIPLAARIIAVADVIDAMAHRRAFRDALPWPDIVAYLREYRGRRFDPQLIDLVFESLGEFEPGKIAAASAGREA
jgi:HD-GYP domain-containing protein (c-di-GMP phosphodiesterase class II)